MTRCRRPVPGGRLLPLSVLFLVSSLAALRVAEGGPPRQALRWPLGSQADLVSSFGEYRYDRLHAGIDISTGGATGLPVLAAGPGTIFRLKVEWRGYGRALYIRHPDGRQTVYGHLERFEDKVLGLERRVARRQEEQRTRYPGDLFLDPPVAVRRGQVIGFSGESGVGLPHLHFEVREADDAPLDPFLAGIAPPADRRSPVIESLTVTAADVVTFLDGCLRERTYRVVRRGSALQAEEPVRATGPFLVAVSAYDPTTGGHAGIHALETRIDGTLRYRLVFRSFRFDQNPLSGLIFDHRSSHLSPSSFAYRLSGLPGNVLAETGYAEAGPAREATYPGAFDLPPGAHVLEVAVLDAAGNRTGASACVLVGAPGAPRVPEEALAGGGPSSRELRFTLDPPAGGRSRVAERPALCPASLRAVEGEVWDPRDGRFRALACRAETGACVPRRPGEDFGGIVRLREVRDGVPGPWVLAAGRRVSPSTARLRDSRVEAFPGFFDLIVPADAPLAALGDPSTGLAAPYASPLRYRDDSLYAFAVSYREAAKSATPAPPGGPAKEGAPPPLDILLAAPGEPARYRAPGFAIDLPAGSRFYPGPLAVRTVPVEEEPGLPGIGAAVDLLPEGEPLNERATLTFDLPEGEPRPGALGVYRWDRVAARWRYEGGEIDRSGRGLSVGFRRYGRFALLRDASPPEILEVRPADGARGVAPGTRIEATVKETGIGLNFDGVEFQVDGRPLESEFDPDRSRSQVLSVPSLAAGRHTLRVLATDRAGNASAAVVVSFEVRGSKAPP